MNAAAAHPLANGTRRLPVRIIIAWLAFGVVVACVCLVTRHAEGWQRMAAISVAMFFALKTMTLIEGFRGAPQPSWTRAGIYLILWPGMNARRFLQVSAERSPKTIEWLGASANMAFGLLLILAVQPRMTEFPLVRAWIGMVGIVFTLHFGAFYLLSCILRSQGFDAPPLMRIPAAAARVSEFWGQRWNTAFRDLSETLILRPLSRMVPPLGASLAVFLISGLIHDAAISFPARGGYGGPLAYFLIQWIGIALERTRTVSRWTMRSPLAGRALTLMVTAAPLPLLFHRPFAERVILPLLALIPGY